MGILDGSGLVAVILVAVRIGSCNQSGKNIGHGHVFDENFLMTLATVGAFALRDFDEGAAVMLFYQVGELFQSIAVERSAVLWRL